MAEQPTETAQRDPRAKRPREPRLDFFRGIAMFIILLAHTPGNSWTLWIPARFGFSDATEIFVFCSGLASALAFGAVFANKGFLLGAARIGFRVWQVYWAHVGIFLFTAAMLFAIDHFGIGNRDIPYIEGPYVVPFFERTGEALIGLLTLTYVPGLFDILPMYLVILGMIPLVMGLHRLGGPRAVFAGMIAVWAMANLAGYARLIEGVEDPAPWQEAIAALGRPFLWMNLPANPFGENTWFFNPFAWQIVFFTGFAFGMGWLPAPPVTRPLVLAAAAVVLLTIPLAWYKIHGGYSLIAGTWAHDAVVALRAFLEPLRWKTWQGFGRFAHFLAVAYLAWAAVGPRGVRLTEGFPAPAPSRRWTRAAAAVLLLTLPVAYPAETDALFPGYAAVVDARLSFNQQGMLQLAHLVALVLVIWAAVGPSGRRWLARDMVLKAVPVIRKVGTQSLAVFVVSIPLARFNGWLMDVLGRDVWTRAGVNLAGFAILIGVAYLVGWLKRQPWRDGARPASPGARAAAPGLAGPGGAVPAQPA